MLLSVSVNKKEHKWQLESQKTIRLLLWRLTTACPFQEFHSAKAVL
jgi:hypothetical protein